jgi:hypothetical protein
LEYKYIQTKRGTGSGPDASHVSFIMMVHHGPEVFKSNILGLESKCFASNVVVVVIVVVVTIIKFTLF